MSIPPFAVALLFALAAAPESPWAQEAAAAHPPEGSGGDGVPEGWKIVHGDILVPEGFDTAEADYTTTLWIDGIVPYEFDENVSDLNKSRSVAAMEEWESVANVDFVPKQAGHGSWIHFQDADNNSSPIGMQGGMQVLNMTSWSSHYVIMHELGHALAYWHEQSRVDRDLYVTINWCNIQGSSSCDPNGSGKADNFEIVPSSFFYGPYDFDSVMHYDDDSFDECGAVACAAAVCNQSPCTTIDVKEPWAAQWQDEIGQRDHLSFWDQRVMSFLYPEPDWVFVDFDVVPPMGVEDGSFRFPYDTLEEGLLVVPSGGTIWILSQPGTFDVDDEIDREVTIRAAIGPVELE